MNYKYKDFTIYTCKVLKNYGEISIYIHEPHMEVKEISIQLSLPFPKAEKSNHEHLPWKTEVFHMIIMAM